MNEAAVQGLGPCLRWSGYVVFWLIVISGSSSGSLVVVVVVSSWILTYMNCIGSHQDDQTTSVDTWKLLSYHYTVFSTRSQHGLASIISDNQTDRRSCHILSPKFLLSSARLEYVSCQWALLSMQTILPNCFRFAAQRCARSSLYRDATGSRFGPFERTGEWTSTFTYVGSNSRSSHFVLRWPFLVDILAVLSALI